MKQKYWKSAKLLVSNLDEIYKEAVDSSLKKLFHLNFVGTDYRIEPK